jgi:glycosyltransferase involved in cell wall biosynthesis
MKAEKETLVILSPGFPENEGDTTCLPPQQVFVKALKSICPGLDVIVLSFHYPFCVGEYQWNGIKVIALAGRDKGRFYRVTTWLRAWRALKKLNRQHNVIGLLSFWFGECAFVGDKFAKENQLQHYTWLLGQDAKRGNKYFRWIKPNGDNLIALSDFLAAEVKRNYNIMPAQVIPVGIDTCLFGHAPVKRDIDILGAGSLISLKQYEHFIKALYFVKEFIPGIKAVLCGKGPELEKLKALADSLNVTDNVTFAGELPHREVLALMQRTKVFLHPSKYEGFGAVLSEALYAGAHVISFCKPMNKAFRHHYVVKSADDMNYTTLTILQDHKKTHEPVLTYPIEKIARDMISLYAGDLQR